MDKEASLEQLILDSQQVFYRAFHRQQQGTISCPGRINILGEHTDYMGGMSLPAAINRFTLISYAPLPTNQFIFWSESHGEYWETDISLLQKPVNTWQLFAYGALSIIKELIHDRPQALKSPSGACFSIMGNIPLGKGLSSSASLELSLLNSLYQVFSLTIKPMNSIKYAQRIEHDFLGVPSGLLDQFACQFSDKNKIQLVDFENLSMQQEYHKGLTDWKWVCIDSGIKRTLGSSEYPKRVNQCEQALDTIKKHNTKVTNYRQITINDLEFLNHDSMIKSRMQHMLSENQRTVDGFKALMNGDINKLGSLLNHSHLSLRDLFEVSTKELDFLQNLAANHPACAGARMMGGGFGGCTLNLVKADACENFLAEVLTSYAKEFKINTHGFIFDLVDGVKI
ncbi:MAG: galactokinase [Oligoflexales bacterium]